MGLYSVQEQENKFVLQTGVYACPKIDSM